MKKNKLQILIESEDHYDLVIALLPSDLDLAQMIDFSVKSEGNCPCCIASKLKNKLMTSIYNRLHYLEKEKEV